MLQREAPGIAEALRADSIAKTPHGLLSRGVAGVVGQHARRQPARLDRRLPRRLRRPAAGARPRACRCSPTQPDPASADLQPDVQAARLYYRLVKFEHTIFALPFAYVGAFLAVDGVPSAHDLLWITLAMVGARSLAMALNRLIDARIDAANPRTATRELPVGRAHVARRSSRSALAALAVYLVAVWQLDPLVRWLSPIPVVAFVVYPYLKRFTWLCHLWLGAVDGLAPVGAWAAIKGDAAVAGVGARRRGRRLGRGLRPLLRAVRRRGRPRAGAALVGDALRRARRVRRRARAAPRDDRAARRGGRRARRRLPLLARRRDRRGAAPVRAHARAARRPAPARRRVLHDERRHLGRVLRVRARRRAVIVGLLHPGEMGAAVGRCAAGERPRGALGVRGPERRDARARRGVPRRRHASRRSHARPS